MPNEHLMGFAPKDDDTPQPNRAQRRAMERSRAAQKRRGQRAYARALRNVDRMTPDEAAQALSDIHRAAQR
jgi:hypothetical protein